jgi:TatD DNase family protein
MIDTHCHIDLYSNPLLVANEVEQKRITTIAVTNLPSHFEMGYNHLRNFKHIRLALGLHPLYADTHSLLELNKFKALVKKTSYIGEVGLDFSREGISTKVKQVNSFRYVLSHISDRPRYITIHSRKSEETVLEMMNEFSISGAVFHWYSGSVSFLDKIVEAGHFFSVNPAMLLSKKGCKIIENIPPERLLTESDGPFVKVGGKVIKPYNISSVLEHLMSVWGLNYDEVEDQIYNNFKSVIKPIKDYNNGLT